MKVVSSKEMARIEQLAYLDGAKEEKFMEAAGRGVALLIQEFTEKNGSCLVATLLCGKGNNAGDAYVAAVYLKKMGFSVAAYSTHPLQECSPLCKKNAERFISQGGSILQIQSETDCAFPKTGILIDGLFGTGFHGKVDARTASIINCANHSKLPIIAIDIPSGLNGETGEVESVAIMATETIFLGLPKTGFFLKSGWNHVGALRHVDFGLQTSYLEKGEEDFILLQDSLVKTLLPSIPRIRHKYTAGLVVSLAGSSGMTGSANLSSLAALRAGAGMVKLLHREGMEQEFSSSPYEVVKRPFKKGDEEFLLQTINKASSFLVGPGLSQDEWSKELLQYLLKNLQVPTVIDATALHLIAECNFPIPKKAILTPHLGELTRLLKKEKIESLTSALLQECQEFVQKNQAVMVLKSHLTFIFAPDKPILLSARGDKGMATAGSGDVLTGIIAGFLAQKMDLRDASIIGAYLHGMAGELAAKKLTSYSLIASDLIHYLSKSLKIIEMGS